MTSGSGCLGTALKGLAVVCAIMFAPALPLALLANNIGQALLSPDVVASVLRERLVETGALEEMLIEGMAADRGSEETAEAEADALGRLMAGASQEDRELIIQRLFGGEWLAAQVDGLVRSFYAWIDSAEPAPNLTVDIRPVKQRLLGPEAAEIVEIVLDGQPACTLRQVDEMVAVMAATGEVPFLECEPPEPLRSEIAALATHTLQTEAQAFPDTQPLLPPNPDGRVDPGLADLKTAIRTARLLSRWGWLLPASLLGLIMALAVRSWRGLAAWWGVPLVLGGGISLGLVPLASRFAGELVRRAAEGPGLGPIADMMRSLGFGMLNEVLRRQVLDGAAVAILGVALLVARRFLPKPAPAPRGAPAQEGMVFASASLVPNGTDEDQRKRPRGMFG